MAVADIISTAFTITTLLIARDYDCRQLSEMHSTLGTLLERENALEKRIMFVIWYTSIPAVMSLYLLVTMYQIDIRKLYWKDKKLTSLKRYRVLN